jgi:hypothetical protein
LMAAGVIINMSRDTHVARHPCGETPM